LGMACSYTPTAEMRLMLGLEHVVGCHLNASLGLEWTIAGQVFVRGAIHRAPDVYAMGAGFKHQLGRVDYAIRIHPILGPTHEFELTIFLG
jgi:hypothetical protein